jgi:glycosyltransferase involved in cell wall biosynthesis
MKVFIPYTGYWPHVRRGVERCIHDIATYLAARGDEVHVVTSTPGRPHTEVQEGVRVTYLGQLNHPLVYRYNPLWRLDAFAFAAARILLREKPDVTYLWTHSGLTFMPFLKLWRRLPYVFHVSVYWPPGKARRWYPEMASADQILTLNHGAAALVSAEFPGVPCRVLPPPVDMRIFKPVAPRDLDRPVVLFPADLADARKGGQLLLRAWERIHRAWPRARLVLAGSLGVAGWLQDRAGQSTVSQLDLVRSRAARDAVELQGPGSLEQLAARYASAAVTVLPSVHEMFGMVLTESLACGTPVVASAHDGPGEILRQRNVAVPVDLKTMSDLVSVGKARELADAVLEAIELAHDPDTSRRCREWAARWSLDRIGSQTAEVLESVAGGRPLRSDVAGGFVGAAR